MTAAAFEQGIRQWILQAQAGSRAVFLGSVVEAFNSVVTGSEITGAPGQPVDTGYLRASIAMGVNGEPNYSTRGDGSDNAGTAEAPLPAPIVLPSVPLGIMDGSVTNVVIGTNAEYAETIEDGARRVGPTDDQGFRKLPGPLRFRSATGGAHSFKLTAAAWPQIVEKHARDAGFTE